MFLGVTTAADLKLAAVVVSALAFAIALFSLSWLKGQVKAGKSLAANLSAVMACFAFCIFIAWQIHLGLLQPETLESPAHFLEILARHILQKLILGASIWASLAIAATALLVFLSRDAYRFMPMKKYRASWQEDRKNRCLLLDESPSPRMRENLPNYSDLR